MNKQDTASVTVFAIGAAALAVTQQPLLIWALFAAAGVGTAYVSLRQHGLIK